ncbi:MAG: hypothetical protein JKX92_13140 [Porticoccaceae bacterium]|nr:hypothetical protein [Porticoccaceae bacterium]
MIGDRASRLLGADKKNLLHGAFIFSLGRASSDFISREIHRGLPPSPILAISAARGIERLAASPNQSLFAICPPLFGFIVQAYGGMPGNAP